jgi:hypothetical protein
MHQINEHHDYTIRTLPGGAPLGRGRLSFVQLEHDGRISQAMPAPHSSSEFDILFMEGGPPSSKDRVLVGLVWWSKVTGNEAYDILGTIACIGIILEQVRHCGLPWLH